MRDFRVEGFARVRDVREAEAQLHFTLKDDRHVGEWFRTPLQVALRLLSSIERRF